MQNFLEMHNFTERIGLVLEKLRSADAILIGAGAGLTTSAGLEYAGDSFREQFADYIEKYHFTDLYSSGFYPFPTENERWAYWARHVNFTRFAPAALPLYLDLEKLVHGKNYFVLTTNVDGQFFKAAFNRQRVMAIQGDYGEMQCARACHPKVYANEQTVLNILANSRNFTVDDEYIPLCPVCKGPMDMHLRKDEYFVEDSAWHAAYERYINFVKSNFASRLLIMELGVGFNTPGIIRYPFEKLAMMNPEACLVRINKNCAHVPEELRKRSVSFPDDASQVISAILNSA